MKRGKYFRLVADILADDINIGEHMIMKGYAMEYYGKGKKTNWCNVKKLDKRIRKNIKLYC